MESLKPPSSKVAEALKFLSDIPLFSNLDEKGLRLLVQASKFQHMEKGTILFFQSDPSDFAYIVRHGDISIMLNSPDGRDMVINEMRPGDIFGELGILTQQPRSTSAIARADSEVLVIPRESFLRVVDSEPQLARRILEVTAQRLQRSGEREGALAFMDAQARLARLLLELEKEEKAKGYVTISQEELAHRTGLIRQTVAKALGKWRRAGWLITGRGRILILNHGALAELEKKLLT
jgi:CRP/FNR family transcriptional regulator, cyclic AMP receptor protein